MGPETSHAITIPIANRNAAGRPVNAAVLFAKRENQERGFVGRMRKNLASQSELAAIVWHRAHAWDCAYAASRYLELQRRRLGWLRFAREAGVVTVFDRGEQVSVRG